MVRAFSRRGMIRSAVAIPSVLCLSRLVQPGRAAGPTASGVGGSGVSADPTRDWLAKWEPYIISSSRNRYCDRETGEEIGWLISPYLSGFCYGYLATKDRKWLDRLFDWADAWVRRGVKEPDGFVGWPKSESGGMYAKEFYTDNQLGEAMGLRPLVVAAATILKTPELKDLADRARTYLELSEATFRKWDARSCWRQVKGGGLWVVPAFGLDPSAKKWVGDYAGRAKTGFSHPANKQNVIALWLLEMADATGKAIYRERAAQWFELMKSRIRLREGKFVVWNYWDPAGAWDYKKDHSTAHWVGVHPNGGYYAIDVEGMVGAFERGVVFTKEDIDRLIATNRDFMWNKQVRGAKFQRIDGGKPQGRWSPGVVWTALARHDAKLREIFEANHNPASWGGLAGTPGYLARRKN